jgi:CIC family chloride channel protein
VDEAGQLVGVLTRGDIRERIKEHGDALLLRPLRELVRTDTIVVNPDESLRVVVYRMAERGFTTMPVVDRETGKLLGLVSLDDLLKARGRHLEEERRRERPLKLRFLLPGGKLSSTEKPAAQ